MSAVSAFQTAITNNLVDQHLEVALWRGGTRTSANLLKISTKPKPTVLYVKESNSSPGFWGLTNNQLMRLETAQVRWFAVFLARSSDVGYVLPGDQVTLRVQDGTFELSHDGDHKVNEGSDLTADQAFQSVDELLNRVL